MARKVTVFTLAMLLSGAAVAATVSVGMPALTFADFVEAWPETDQFTDGMLERVMAYPSALHGRATARRDIAAGRLAFKIWGLPAPWRFIFSDVLRSHGVDSTVVAGCVVSQPRLAAWEGYNDVMLSEVAHRYGEAFIDATATQAQAEFERRRARGELRGNVHGRHALKHTTVN